MNSFFYLTRQFDLIAMFVVLLDISNWPFPENSMTTAVLTKLWFIQNSMSYHFHYIVKVNMLKLALGGADGLRP
jgi:hypothetical protein